MVRIEAKMWAEWANPRVGWQSRSWRVLGASAGAWVCGTAHTPQKKIKKRLTTLHNVL